MAEPSTSSASPPTSLPALADPATKALLRACVHCGICLPQCPTYRVLGEEMNSPRGRIYLMRAVAEGRLDVTDTVTEHLDLCLGCRACETACPAGVRFGTLLETARADMGRRAQRRRRRRLSDLLLTVFPDPERLDMGVRPPRPSQRPGPAGPARPSGLRG